jgi:hypothetical protein
VFFVLFFGTLLLCTIARYRPKQRQKQDFED